MYKEYDDLTPDEVDAIVLRIRNGEHPITIASDVGLDIHTVHMCKAFYNTRPPKRGNKEK